MLNQQKPLWTQEESIAFECAKEVMNDIIGICSCLLGVEQKKASPNLSRMAELEQKRYDLLKERDAICWNDTAKIAHIRREYGAKIRAYRSGGTCPV